MKNTAFKVIVSTKDFVRIDLDEVDTVLKGISEGRVVRVRQGVINPSYFVAIVEDTERLDRFLDETRHDTEARQRGMFQLKDVLLKSKVNLLNK